MDVKVSVIMPVYNAEKHLKETLDAVLGQSFADFELICVDDGSTDQSVTILEEYQSKDKRIQILRQQNQFAGVARNNGFDQASGKYVIFLDADDIFDLDLLKELYEACEREDAEVAVCGAKAFFQDQNHYHYPANYMDFNLLPEQSCFSAEDIADHIFQFTLPAPWNKMFRRDFILEHEIRFMPLKRTNDYFFVFKALSCAKRITAVPKCLVAYRKENTTSLQSTNDYHQPDFYLALVKQFKDLKKRGVFKLFSKSFCNRALSVCMFNLTKVKTEEQFALIYPIIVEAAHRFGLINHPRPFYYSKGEFDQLVQLLGSSPEAAWEEYKNKLEQTAELINPSDYPQGYLEAPNDSPVISVVVPVYNVENYLAECLDSLLCQTLENIEIICVNDGSTDGSPEILNDYQKKDSRIRVINQENGGLSCARNTGFKAAHGEYVHFLDSDDYVHPRTYEILYQKAKANNLDLLVFCGETFYDPENIRYQKHIFAPNYIKKYNYSNLHTGKELFCSMVEKYEYRSQPSMYISKTSFLRENNLIFPEDIRLHEDEFYTPILLLKANRAEYLNSHFYYRRVRANSLMTESSELRSAKGYIYVISKLSNFYFDDKLYTDLKLSEQYMSQLQRLYMNAWRKIRSFHDEAISNELQEYVLSLEIALYPSLMITEENMKMLSSAQTSKMRIHQIWDLKRKLKDQKQKNRESSETILTLKEQNKELKAQVKSMKKELEDSRSQAYKILRKIKRTLWK